jgi:hypothetical protein
MLFLSDLRALRGEKSDAGQVFQQPAGGYGKP